MYSFQINELFYAVFPSSECDGDHSPANSTGPMTRLLTISAVAFGLWLLPYSGDAQDISVEARVIDGMTLEVQGQRLRLFGIDAPDLKQTCRWPNKVIPCG